MSYELSDSNIHNESSINLDEKSDDSSDEPLLFPDSTPASKPFDRKDADIIFRTVDNVDFYLHKPVVSIASPMLDDRVAKAFASPHLILEGRPILLVSDESIVFNALLRFCYPTPRPTFSTLSELRDVLCAANDYDLRFVVDALREPLLSYAEELPLQVYCIACRNNMEECARTAAEYAVRKPFWETYVPEIEFITAGAYWKLLSYYWDSDKARRRTKNKKSPQLHWRTQDLQLSVPSTKPSSPLPSAASFPFDSISDGDVILRSADGVQFRAHKIILAMSSGFFRDMFNIPQGYAEQSANDAESLAVIPFTESSETLDSLLRTIYPVDEPDLKLIQDIKSVLEAAIKYDIPKGTFMMKKKLIACASKEPIRVFLIACRNRLTDVAKAAAEASLKRPILYSFERGSMVLPIWDAVDISAGILYRLIEYQLKCSEVVRKELSDLKWVKEDFAWKSKVLMVVKQPCEMCCSVFLDIGEERYQIATWFKVFQDEISAGVRQRPCTSIVMEESMMDRALSVASKCRNCFKDSINTLRTFRGIITQHLDRELAKVQLDFNF